MLPLFTIQKSPYPMGQPAYLEKMTLVWGRDCPLWSNQASEVLKDLSSHKPDHDNQDHKKLLGSNKYSAGPLEALSARPSKASDADAVYYTKKTYNK